MEVIKGQDELKRAVEKLESELFKDWPAKAKNINMGFVISGCYPITITNCKMNQLECMEYE